MPFIVAARSTLSGLVAWLLTAASEDANNPNDADDRLHLAAVDGNCAKARRLLNSGGVVIEVDALDARGRSALIVAAIHNRPEMARLLLERGAAVDIRDADCRTALFHAIQRRSKPLVELLLETGYRVEWTQWPENELKHVVEAIADCADINAPDADGWTPLHNVVSFRMAEGQQRVTLCARLLLDAGAEIDAPTVSANGCTALMLAAKEGHRDALQLLLNRGAAVNARDANGNSALMRAADAGHCDALQLLLNRGAEVNARDVDGNSALIYATFHRQREAAALLIERGGASVALKGTLDRSALDRSALDRAVAIKSRPLTELLLTHVAHATRMEWLEWLQAHRRTHPESRATRLKEEEVSLLSRVQHPQELGALVADLTQDLLTAYAERSADSQRRTINRETSNETSLPAPESEGRRDRHPHKLRALVVDVTAQDSITDADNAAAPPMVQPLNNNGVRFVFDF